jgi:aminoglycoside N3'-acetyltransferase
VSTLLLVSQLRDLGVNPNGVLVVHTAFSRVKPIDGGPETLIAALREAVGPAGTLVMPSMSDDDDHPFDVRSTPCRSLGIVADTFWRMPGVLRSDSPHAFAAIGPHAAEITCPHPADLPHGPGTPIARTHDLDAQVLLLGCGHDANTTVHLAENLAGVRYGIEYHVTMLENGTPKRVEYREVDHCCEGFALLDEWLGDKQRRGIVGRGEARLMNARDVVETALQHLREQEDVFLHLRGVCEECDDARSSP